ncbi:MAG: hypothetical protein AAF628_34330 [Planctomycetota bacterium]
MAGLSRLGHPAAASVAYNLACFHARQDQRKPALTALRAAVEAGFRQVDHMSQDTDLASLREEPAFAAILVV